MGTTISYKHASLMRRLFGDISILIFAGIVLTQGIGEFRKAQEKALLIIGTMLLVCFFITLIPSETTALIYHDVHPGSYGHGWGCFFAFILTVILGYDYCIQLIISKKCW